MKADDSAGRTVPSPLNDEPTIVSNAQPAHALEPAYGPLDDPTHATEAAAVFFTTARDPRADTKPAQNV